MPQKPLIQLQNIGKIYVSEGNVAVGIRGVNLSFSRGEFVAVTGESGSGKSTLLNVISGMDTYEEGEMYIDGEPTSHYVQKDWETYREDYISFIFQDYNIIESFTVLQNVELALMHIEDPRARRARAMELIRRVGLEAHIKHKGSKLSGGQKQRTVIARALAKDSPVILADEPTGNLDSQSSREIIELLREVSRDKLVIIVTHNFDEVEHCATRHVRVFDGAVELDHTIRPAPDVTDTSALGAPVQPLVTGGKKALRTLRDGAHLGSIRFRAMPKLAIFLCCLMTLTSLVITFMTASSYDATDYIEAPLMFTHVDGRVVIARVDGAVIGEDELAKLQADIGASDTMHYDFMLDRKVWVNFENERSFLNLRFSFGYPAEGLSLDAGRHPTADNEVILEVPISAKPFLGENGFEEQDLPLLFDMATYRVVGVRYYYDNTRTPRMLFTENGYKVASSIAFFKEQKDNFHYNLNLQKSDAEGDIHGMWIDTYVDFTLPEKSYFLNVPMLYEKFDEASYDKVYASGLCGSFRNHVYIDSDHYYYDEDIWVYPDKPTDGKEQVNYDMSPVRRVLAAEMPAASRAAYEQHFHQMWEAPVGLMYVDFVALSPDLLMDFLYEHYFTKAYTQASLFFENDRVAHGKVEALRDLGYIAVVSDETVTLEASELLLNRILFVVALFSWAVTVIFAAMVLALCSSRAMNAIRGDIAIMRSMGIPTAVVKVSIYIQTLIALIPAFIVTAVAAVVVYTNPVTNAKFAFLHAGEYALLAVALVAIAFVLSHKQAAKMFNESVKKTLKGGKKS